MSSKKWWKEKVSLIFCSGWWQREGKFHKHQLLCTRTSLEPCEVNSAQRCCSFQNFWAVLITWCNGLDLVLKSWCLLYPGTLREYCLKCRSLFVKNIFGGFPWVGSPNSDLGSAPRTPVEPPPGKRLSPDSRGLISLGKTNADRRKIGSTLCTQIQTSVLVFISAGSSGDGGVNSNSYNVVMVGNSSVGKTSFMRRVQNGRFFSDLPSSIGKKHRNQQTSGYKTKSFASEMLFFCPSLLTNPANAQKNELFTLCRAGHVPVAGDGGGKTRRAAVVGHGRSGKASFPESSDTTERGVQTFNGCIISLLGCVRREFIREPRERDQIMISSDFGWSLQPLHLL